jgi:outer membrane lipoprotein-sorting protein
MQAMLRFLALTATLMTAAPAVAERASLEDLSAYLNTIDTAQADFTQSNADGTTSRGTLYIERPGRIRFEYAPPNEDVLVVAGGGQVAVFDGVGGGGPEQFPLRRTPLNLILAPEVDLTRMSMVTGHGEQGGRTVVQAQDPDHPEYGRIYLYFERSPLRLSEWLIVSETGEHTRVRLSPFEPKDDFPASFFSISQIADSRD